jgi:hypothetical protein
LGRHPFGDEALESEAFLLATAVAGASLDDWLRQRAEHLFILQAFLESKYDGVSLLTGPMRLRRSS